MESREKDLTDVRLNRLEAILFGPDTDESGGLRAQIAMLSTKMDKMTFWFRVGGIGIIVFFVLFGPEHIKDLLELLRGIK